MSSPLSEAQDALCAAVREMSPAETSAVLNALGRGAEDSTSNGSQQAACSRIALLLFELYSSTE